MDFNNSTPNRLPRPSPSVLNSAGSLKKRNQISSEKIQYTPETPSKKEKNKFHVPASISPFALSPKLLSLDSTHSSKACSTLNNSKLSEMHYPEERNGGHIFSGRSSSPTRHNGYDSLQSELHMDAFNLNDFDCEDYAEEYNEDTLVFSAPWKTRFPVFFGEEFFMPTDWSVKLEKHLYDSTSKNDGDYFENSFEIIEDLGRGSFSDVFKVRRKNEDQYLALKRSRFPCCGFSELFQKLREVECMWAVDSNAHCVKIFESWMQNGFIYILTELCSNGSLKDVIDYMTRSQSRFTEYQVWQILLQIASGLFCVHSKGIIHRDIKPANIMITENGVLKLGDFGLSIKYGEVVDADSEGDKYYMAPETLDGCIGFFSDIFSLGLVVLELAFDVELPSQGQSWQNLRHGDLNEISLDGVSSTLLCLIRAMIDPEPLKRPALADIIQISWEQSNRMIENTQ